MDEFEKAINEIKKEYPVRMMGEKYAQIELDILFDSYNYIFIGVLFDDDLVLLTDFADYAQICEWEDEDVPNIEKICQKYGIAFMNYHIECIYKDNKDVKRYLDCLLELKNIYGEKDV